MNAFRSLILGGTLAAGVIHASGQLTWGSRDVLYEPTTPMPLAVVTDTVINVWRGERLGALALVASDKPTAMTAKLSGEMDGRAYFMDFVLTDGFRGCGAHPDNLPARRVADIIDTTGAAAMVTVGETKPIWVSIEVPESALPGIYVDTLTVDGWQIRLRVNVQDWVMPPARDREFYLNLWQQPYSVARYYGVEPWSEEHFDLLRPYARMLAKAGQRAISTVLIHEPWGEQSNDLFLPMVETRLTADGEWAYDYDVFDRWVQFMLDNGVGPDIECFSMIPWEMKFRYFDESSGTYEYLQTTTGADDYARFWTSLLSSLRTHLKEKGWIRHAAIAMDERSMEDMANALNIIRRSAPELKVSLAGNYHPEFADSLYSLSLTLGFPYPPGKVSERRARGQVSTLYTCCSSPQPNLFSNSDPADAAWIPLYCKLTGHDGYLHWSWMNWTDDPMNDSRFKLFSPGDTYFVYPEGRSSVRFERLIEGIQLCEKVRILREKLPAEQLRMLNDALIPIMLNQVDRNSTTAMQVNYAVKIIDYLSNRTK